jgi:thioredoxin 1
MDELEEIRKKKMKELLDRKKRLDEAKSFPNTAIVITDASFHETIQRFPLVVVDCWAAWCAPCKKIALIIDKLAQELAGKVVFAKLNTDENRATAIQYQVMSIPTLLIMKGGVEVDRIVGAVPKKVIEGKLIKFIVDQ